MKQLALIAIACAVLCTPAFAGGSSENTLNIGAVAATGKSGLLGTLLGTNSNHGATDIGANLNVSTGAGGVVGLLLGSLGSNHGSW